MANSSESKDISQDVDKKSDLGFDSSTLSSGNSKEVETSQVMDQKSGPGSDPPTSSPGNSHDVPQDIKNDPDSKPGEPNPPLHPCPFPTPLLDFLQPDNYLFQFILDYQRYRNPRARG